MTNSYELGEYLYTETTIRAPVRTVWPVLLDMSRWYTDYHWDWISGPLYDGVGLQEGQVLKAIMAQRWRIHPCSRPVMRNLCQWSMGLRCAISSRSITGISQK